MFFPSLSLSLSLSSSSLDVVCSQEHVPCMCFSTARQYTGSQKQCFWQTMLSFLANRHKMTKMAGVTQAKPWFTKHIIFLPWNTSFFFPETPSALLPSPLPPDLCVVGHVVRQLLLPALVRDALLCAALVWFLCCFFVVTNMVLYVAFSISKLATCRTFLFPYFSFLRWFFWNLPVFRIETSWGAFLSCFFFCLILICRWFVLCLWQHTHTTKDLPCDLAQVLGDLARPYPSDRGGSWGWRVVP